MIYLIAELLFVCLLAIVPCGIMTFINATLNHRLTAKTTFCVQMASVLIGAIIGAIVISYLVPTEEEIYKLGLYGYGPGFGFVLGNLILLAIKDSSSKENAKA